MAEKCTIQLAYAIGVAEPVSVYVDTHGRGTGNDNSLQDQLRGLVDLTPKGIRTHLGLNAPIYAPTSAYGHFGRKAGEAGAGTFPWEAVDIAAKLL